MTLKNVEVVAPELLFGDVDNDLVLIEKFNSRFHKSVIGPLIQLATNAEAAGFCLKVASSYRSFERQLLIWNDKAAGKRAVLDDAGIAVDTTLLSDEEKMFAILRWSALPGASRHHWGTDFDVYDAAHITPDYKLQLTLDETESGGPFEKFHQWLTTDLENNSHGFFRPYLAGVGGIAPEPWHLSYAPIANQYATQLSETILRTKIQSTDIALKDSILENLDKIFQLYINPYCSNTN